MASHNGVVMSAVTVEQRRLRRGARRGLLIGAAAVLGVGLVAAHADTCYALAAEAYQSVTDSYLVMWIERAGAALGCF